MVSGTLCAARAQITVARATPIAGIPVPESLLLHFRVDCEREERMAEEAALEAAGGEPAPELATSFVAEPD